METLKFKNMEIAPEYGRILKLEPISGVNVFWNNPVNEKTCYNWFNPGGDRVWISPECELFMASATDSSYAVPDGIDPGKCHVERLTADEIVLVNDISLDFIRFGKKMNLKMTRTITGIESDAPDGVAFAGYKQKLLLEAKENFSSELRPALWSIVQLPPGGRILFPEGKLELFTGKLPELELENGIYCVPVPSPGNSFKIGLSSLQSKGIMAYLNVDCENPSLVIRSFEPVKNGRYADVPADAPDLPCVQEFYFDDGALGGFGEMEYHSQYITPEIPSVTDTSILKAYSGTPEQLKEIIVREFDKVR